MDRVVALVNVEGVDLVFGNDFDVDCLAVMVWVGGELCALMGDDVGVVLGSVFLGAYSLDRNCMDKVFVVIIIVLFELFVWIAWYYYVDCIEIFIGFKWLWNVLLECESVGGRFVMCYEEVLGYCVGMVVWDKDGLGVVFLVVRFVQSDFLIWECLEDVWICYGYMMIR